MSKSVLIAVLGFVGFGASAQGFSGTVSNSSLSAGQQGSVTSSTTTTTTVGTTFTGVMMNNPEDVSGTFQNGAILMDGDSIEILAFNNFGSLEFKGSVVSATFSQLVVLGKDDISGQIISLTLENANSNAPDGDIEVNIPSTGDVYVLKSL
jgi:hypothetical protein